MTLLDREDRERAIHERERNVLVEASAGTGKTRLVVDRLVELVAPAGEHPPLSIDRIAAITFTRKAAGELALRARQRLLEELAATPLDVPRAAALVRALDGIDTAMITTIHGFADRLLRRWPAQARLDPRYTLEDDGARLAEECFQRLVHAAETGTLGDLVRGTSAEAYAEEAVATVIELQRAGLRLRSVETEHWTHHGLDGLVTGFVLHRDLELSVPEHHALDRTGLARGIAALGRAVEHVSIETRGGRWLVEVAALARHVADDPDPAAIYRELVDRLERGPRGRASDPPRRKHDFGGDELAWEAWKLFDHALRDDVLRPLRRWLAARLVRLRPVVLAVYDTVKARRRVVDHVDLLLRLRDLLRDDLAIRAACQDHFDHLFVDEFQDTDPLQAEIVLFLCERGARARSWDAVRLAPGKLTIVGDPKQSIYRFRRADLATYRRVVEIASSSPHLAVQLVSSFRSTPALVDWINGRFADVLETVYQPLSASREAGHEPAVHAVAITLPEDRTAAACRVLEAEVMARYVRWLVETSEVTITDPHTAARREIRYGDIGVLAMTTTNLPVLFAAFDRDDVPYASRGGTLFLRDPVHRHFLLGLCALADRDDGVALAALLRPPFFAVDLGDLARGDREDPADRATRARGLVAELRRQRFGRSPGTTARALLEDTGFGRTIALGPNGSQRLAGLRELCFQLEVLSLDEHLDFDGAMERLRTWIDDPPGFDRPHPAGGDAIRVLTVHQAKGLEFPIVVLWDARAAWNERPRHDAWMTDRDGRGWALRLDMLRWEEPEGFGLAAREREMYEEERRRLVYVAATRARDVLVLPKLGVPEERWIFGKLLATSSPAVLEHEPHARGAPARWYLRAAPPSAPVPMETREDADARTSWLDRARAAARGHLCPAAFTDAANPRVSWGKQGRHGALFGETVHLAIGHVLQRRDAAVARAARTTGLRTHLRHAEEDVRRAVLALEHLGIEETFELEYPVSGVDAEGRLVSGYVDLIAIVGGATVLLDFKTDVPPAVGEPLPERYDNQVRGYRDVLVRACGSPIRAGLLYTADGGVRWIP